MLHLRILTTTTTPMLCLFEFPALWLILSYQSTKATCFTAVSYPGSSLYETYTQRTH